RRADRDVLDDAEVERRARAELEPGADRRLDRRVADLLETRGVQLAVAVELSLHPEAPADLPGAAHAPDVAGRSSVGVDPVRLAEHDRPDAPEEAGLAPTRIPTARAEHRQRPVDRAAPGEDSLVAGRQLHRGAQRVAAVPAETPRDAELRVAEAAGAALEHEKFVAADEHVLERPFRARVAAAVGQPERGVPAVDQVVELA